jgi:hypothetical protein
MSRTVLPAASSGEVSFYSVNQVAELLQIGRDTVIRIFANQPGVLVLGSVETTRQRRKYRTLRIPATVLQRYINRHSVKN